MSRKITLNDKWESKTEILKKINKHNIETKVMMSLSIIVMIFSEVILTV